MLVNDYPDNTFYRSVLDFHREKGSITQKQLNCIEKDYERNYEFEPDPNCEYLFSCKSCGSYEECPIYKTKSKGFGLDTIREIDDPEIQRLVEKIDECNSEEYSKVFKKRYLDRQLNKFNWKIKKRLREIGEDYQMQNKQNESNFIEYDIPEWAKTVNEILEKIKKGELSEAKNNR